MEDGLQTIARSAASAALFGVAAFLIVLVLVNRRLMLLKDSRIKAPLIIAHFLVIGTASLVLGWRAPRWPWLALPLAVIGCVLAGEVRRIAIRWRCRGAPPVERTAAPGSPRRPVTTLRVTVARYELTDVRWRGPDFRISHVSDLHLTRALPARYYAEILSKVAETRPDLLFMTGDFVSERGMIEDVADIVRADGRRGTFAVLGNHDHWAGPQRIADVLARAGIRVLRNEATRVALGERGVVVSGCEDPWGAAEWSAPERAAEDLLIVLSHTPDNIYRLARAGAAAVFSGHYHAGQFKLPIVGPVIVPSVYGRRFDHGHFVVGGTHLFVTAGVGAAAPPFRIYCPPDIFVVDVRGAGEGSHSRNV